MSQEVSDLEAEIARLTKDFGTKLSTLSSSPFIRDGVVKEAISSLIWDIYYAMPDQRDALADVLEDMPQIIRGAVREDQDKALEARKSA